MYDIPNQNLLHQFFRLLLHDYQLNLLFTLRIVKERQMQFWEDVEDGLDAVQSTYEEEGLDVERIRGFVKR